MMKTLRLIGIGVLCLNLMTDIHAEDNPRKGTYSERFFVAPAERIKLVEKAIAGDKAAVKKLFLHYQMGSYEPQQALFWAKHGKALGESVTSEFLKAPPHSE